MKPLRTCCLPFQAKKGNKKDDDKSARENTTAGTTTNTTEENTSTSTTTNTNEEPHHFYCEQNMELLEQELQERDLRKKHNERRAYSLPKEISNKR